MRRTQADAESSKRVRKIEAAIIEMDFNYDDILVALVAPEMLPESGDFPEPLEPHEPTVKALRQAIKAAKPPELTFGEYLTAIGRILTSEGEGLLREERRIRNGTLAETE